MRPCLKKPITKGDGGVAQGEGPEFKPQYHIKKKKRKEEKNANSILHKWFCLLLFLFIEPYRLK
jgi:hypothetical protein